MIEKAGASVATVAVAIERASASTGADFDFLMRTAARESGFNPNAKASTSSATGLFQFIDQTWLGMMKAHGAEHGLGQLADQISITKGGRYVVADRQVRKDILALRTDPEIAATMAGEFSEDARKALVDGLGRPVSDGELYTAHLLGPGGAISLIKAADRGAANAAALFPDEARANRAIFYTKNGTARSPAEVIALMGAKHAGAKLPSQAELAALPDPIPTMRGTSRTMDDIVTAGYSPSRAGYGATDTDNVGGTLYPVAMTGRPATDMDNVGATDDASIYTAETAPSVMTPFMAQLLASLDPIPDRVRDAMFRTESDLNRTVEQHA